MFKAKCCVLLVLVCIQSTSSFNIDTSPNTRNMVRPYEFESNQIPTNPIYFGYNFNFRMRSGSSSSIVVGAPKRRGKNNALPQSGTPNADTTNTGGIFTCGVIFSSGQSPSCEPIGLPPNTVTGDSYGLTVQFDNVSDSLLACSPTKQQICGRDMEHIRLPGYCYNRNVDTAIWREDAQTKDLICPPLNRDIIFVVDGSGSVGRANFQIIQNWIIRLASNFNINDGTNRIGVIQYSHYFEDKDIRNQDYIRTEIGLRQYSSQSSFNSAVRRINYQNFTTYTAAALRKSIIDFQGSSRFNDPLTAKVLILLTDGNSSDREVLARDAARVRDLGIITFAVGVRGALVQELRTVATGDINSGNRVFFVQNFNGLDAIANQLASQISNANIEDTRQGDENNGFTLGEYGISLHRRKQVKY